MNRLKLLAILNFVALYPAAAFSAPVFPDSSVANAQAHTDAVITANLTPPVGNNPIGITSLDPRSVVSVSNTDIRTERLPVSTAWAAPLSFPQGTCYVAASAGGQGVTFGLSAAIPIEDKACQARATAQTLNALGEREAAIRYLAAHDAGVRDALERPEFRVK